jgi:hypothetical protein
MGGHMASLRHYYRVPAYRGKRIIFGGGLGDPVHGEIVSAREHKIYVRADDGERIGPLHPTWCITYLADEP